MLKKLETSALNVVKFDIQPLLKHATASKSSIKLEKQGILTTAVLVL